MTATETRDSRCGTYAGYQVHIKVTKTEPCADCRKASREYQAERRRDRIVRNHERALEAARSRALYRLARAYPGSFRAFYREETEGIVAPPRKPRATA